MKIGIDIDDVLVGFVKPFLDTYEKESGIKINFEEVITYDLNQVLNISREDVVKIADKFYDSELFVNNDLLEGAKEFVEEVVKEHEVFLVTSRPTYLSEKTKEFVEKNFPNLNLKVIHSSDFTGEGITKAEVCKRENISVLIEDNKKYVERCAKEGINCFLIDMPWNQNHEESENITRVKNWNEILEKINGF